MAKEVDKQHVINQKASLLKNFALSVLNNPTHSLELRQLFKKLKFTPQQVIQAYIDYDMDVLSYGNEIFEELIIRAVLHVHNLLEGSWHIDRQATIDNFINYVKPNSILDVGFGVPSLYVKNALIRGDTKITLTDIGESAIIFANHLLSLWTPDWKKQINFLCEDMNKTSMSPPAHELYLFQDSIEHVHNPTQCLIDFVKNSPKDTIFLFSLPIGPIIPKHYIAWDSEQEITEWLTECGLKLIASQNILVNPNVDLFADMLNFKYTNMIALCKKI